MPAFAMLLQAVTVPIPPGQRAVRGRTIVSNESPAATLHFSAPFRYVGSQVVRLYGNADAEQHMFVDLAPVNA